MVKKDSNKKEFDFGENYTVTNGEGFTYTFDTGLKPTLDIGYNNTQIILTVGITRVVKERLKTIETVILFRKNEKWEALIELKFRRINR